MQDKKLHKVEFIFNAVKKHYNLRTYRELSEFLGVKEGTLNAWKARNSIGNVEVFITKCKGMSYNWLITGQGEMFNPGSKGNTHKTDINIYDEFSFIPLYNVELSAGGGSFVETEEIACRYAFRREWVQKITPAPGSLALCMVKGESMMPTLHNGDIVMIDTSRKKLSTNGIYCINLGGNAAVKRIEYGVSGKARIISDNTDDYPPYEADTHDIIIVGQVVWFARELVHSCSCNYHI